MMMRSGCWACAIFTSSASVAIWSLARDCPLSDFPTCQSEVCRIRIRLLDQLACRAGPGHAVRALRVKAVSRMDVPTLRR